MLVFSAFTPHSPLLLSEISKDRIQISKKTNDAMKELSEELYASHPDTIVLFSEHPNTYADFFSIGMHDPFEFDMSDFGILEFEKSFRPDIKLIDRIQRDLRKKEQPVTLNTEQKLHYASAVPLTLLTKEIKEVKLVPINYSDLDSKQHFKFGQSLKDVIINSEKRIAVIASGDMSHTLTTNSPANFHKDGEIFDEKIQEIISQKNTAGLISLDQDMIQNAQQTSYRPLTMLFGLLENISVTPQILSYESPYDVGYLVAHFIQK